MIWRARIEVGGAIAPPDRSRAHEKRHHPLTEALCGPEAFHLLSEALDIADTSRSSA